MLHLYTLQKLLKSVPAFGAHNCESTVQKELLSLISREEQHHSPEPYIHLPKKNTSVYNI